MRPESEEPEVSPPAETESSAESVAAAGSESSRPVSAADATSADDAASDRETQEPEAEAADEEPEAEAETPDKPKRARPRRPRRKAVEPAAKEEKPAKPAPRRRRAQLDPDLPPPVVRAQAKYVRSSARKARLVCDNIRGKSVYEARAILALTPRAIAQDWSKLLDSAIANAENNHDLIADDLVIKAI